jgi:hypothetical protein
MADFYEIVAERAGISLESGGLKPEFHVPSLFLTFCSRRPYPVPRMKRVSKIRGQRF